MNKSMNYVLFPLVFIFIDVITFTTSSTFQEEGKIHGGEFSLIQSSPYSALLEPEGLTYFDRCGGSILSINVILTTARCIWVSSVKIRIGNSYDNEGGQVYYSDIFQAHPLAFEIDLGLIRVEEGMMLDGINTRAIELASLGDDPQVGTRILISGWGLMDDDNPRYSFFLKIANVTVYDREDCNQFVRPSMAMNMFCGGVNFDYSYRRIEYPGACKGDFGGPGVNVGTGKQAGIISSTTSSCGSDTYFTRIGSPTVRMFIMAMAGV